MREYKLSTSAGKRVYEMGCRCTALWLCEIYTTWSQAKQRAYEWCREQFSEDENATAFGIGNANTFGFTAKWVTVIDGENAMRVETKDNSFIVWLDR